MNDMHDVIVATESGGDRQNNQQRIRYWIFFTLTDSTAFTDAQRKVVMQICGEIGAPLNCSATVEDTFCASRVVFLSVLVPLDIALDTYITDCMRIIQDDMLLRHHYWCSNMEKPTEADATEYLKFLSAKGL